MLVRNTEVLRIISELPEGKAVGIDRLSSESLLYSDNILSILLSCCFTGMLTHGFLPSSFMDTKIIPLVKNRCADLSDINNYRPVAIANVLSKVFENILLNRCEEYLFTTDNQFGFKSGCSTDLCIYSLRQYIDIFKSKRTTTYVTFLDASKAFDRLNHWTLFDKLLLRGVPKFFIRILCYWYVQQNMCVQWGSSISRKFHVTNGVKQGGILSPKLVNFYMDDLSVRLSEINVGGSIGGKRINHLFYADDVCLLSLSSEGMQNILDICAKYAIEHDLIFNETKTMYMCFSPRGLAPVEAVLKLNGSPINFVKQAKYLGTIIDLHHSDADVKRQMKKLYANVKCYYVNLINVPMILNVCYSNPIVQICTAVSFGILLVKLQ